MPPKVRHDDLESCTTFERQARNREKRGARAKGARGGETGDDALSSVAAAATAATALAASAGANAASATAAAVPTCLAGVLGASWATGSVLVIIGQALGRTLELAYRELCGPEDEGETPRLALCGPPKEALSQEPSEPEKEAAPCSAEPSALRERGVAKADAAAPPQLGEGETPAPKAAGSGEGGEAALALALALRGCDTESSRGSQSYTSKGIGRQGIGSFCKET